MKRVLLLLFTVFIFLLSFSVSAQGDAYQSGKGHILILSSYSHDNEWGTSVSKYIKREIERQNSNIIVATSYANITNRSSFLSGRYSMQAAFANGRISKDRTVPAVLVLVGDESWMYYRVMNLRGIWNKVPVVSVGARPKVLSDYSTFFENKELSDSDLIPLEDSKKGLPMTAVMNEGNELYTVWLMNQLMPQLRRIVFLSTGSYQDEYSLREIREAMVGQYTDLKLTVIHNERNKADSIQQILASLPADHAVLVNTCSIPEGISAPVFQLSDRPLEGDVVIGGNYPSNEDYAIQATSAILRIYDGMPADSIPSALVSGATPYLNEEALERWKMKEQASGIYGVMYSNVPLSFLAIYARWLLMLALAVVIFAIIVVLTIRARRHRSFVMKSFDRFKKVYDEYQVLYENMPMGLAVFNWDGTLLNRNPESDLFFDKIPAKEAQDFNLFKTSMLDKRTRKKIELKQLVNKLFVYEERYLRLVFRYMLDAETNSETILMIVIDNTNIEKERAAKERIYNIFNFAMDEASLGVAEYNMMNKTGFATDAWYKNLHIERDGDWKDLKNPYKNVVGEDRKMIEDFLANIGEDGDVYFMETIRVKKGNKIHWLQYIIQLLEYGPDEGRIIVAEMMLNIDKHKYREEELATALGNAQESDRLKNAFIANMSSDIRPSLDKLVVLSNRLIETDDEAEKIDLMVRIEENNELLLQYVERIIDLSRAGTIKQ